MADGAQIGDCAERRLLRVLFRKLDPVRKRFVYGRALTSDEFAAECDRLGVPTDGSELDRAYEWLAELFGKSLGALDAGSVGMMDAAKGIVRSMTTALRKVSEEDAALFARGSVVAWQWLDRIDRAEDLALEQGECERALQQAILRLGTRGTWSAESLNWVILAAASASERENIAGCRWLFVVGELLKPQGRREMLSEVARSRLPAVREALSSLCASAAEHSSLLAVDESLPESWSAKMFNEGQHWAAGANAIVAELPATRRAAVLAACAFAFGCNASRPSKDWARKAAEFVGACDRATLSEFLRRLLESVRVDRPFADDEGVSREELWKRYAEVAENRNRLCGLAVVAGLVDDDALAGMVAECVESVARLPEEERATARPFAFACLRGLAIAEPPKIAALQRVNYRVKWPPVRKLLQKVIPEAAGKLGLSAVDAEELGVPDFGLTLGRATVRVGDGTAEIAVVDTVKPVVTWRKGDGSVAKTGAGFRKADEAGVKGVAQAMKDIEGMLPAQKNRLELLLRGTRSWRIDAWRERYGDHGLLAPFARRLIWLVDEVPVLFAEGRPEDVEGRAVELGATAEVRVWHPIGRAEGEVLAWRARLEALRVTQPFKQAHREIYVLTEAERRTRTYSNRFAAHIIKAPTLLAIGQARRWKVSLYGHATLELPQFGLRAEYWSNAAGEEMNELGGPRYLSTDQVRFYEPGEPEPRTLESVPALALSEVMRDVDMFVGIGSVANDPTWSDGGTGGRFRDYWHSHSFGELGATAAVRREVLSRLLPRMTKLKGRWELAERFLRVQGRLRGYKIHLGSGNILMEPNDQYLCIVPDRRAAAAQVDFVPFEGDTQMSVILSKALLLIEDDKITDETIVRQIRR